MCDASWPCKVSVGPSGSVRPGLTRKHSCPLTLSTAGGIISSGTMETRINSKEVALCSGLLPFSLALTSPVAFWSHSVIASYLLPHTFPCGSDGTLRSFHNPLQSYVSRSFSSKLDLGPCPERPSYSQGATQVGRYCPRTCFTRETELIY